jgi:hypothetical protein
MYEHRIAARLESAQVENMAGLSAVEGLIAQQSQEGKVSYIVLTSMPMISTHYKFLLVMHAFAYDWKSGHFHA